MTLISTARSEVCSKRAASPHLGLEPVYPMRWTTRCKAEILAAMKAGSLNWDEIGSRYDLTRRELSDWQWAMEQRGNWYVASR